MWSLLEAEWSHVAEVCVQLLLHFITLPCGADIFWKLCETHFNHQDWKVRFQAGQYTVFTLVPNLLFSFSRLNASVPKTCYSLFNYMCSITLGINSRLCIRYVGMPLNIMFH